MAEKSEDWDFEGKAHWEDGEVMLDFGCYKGMTLREIAWDDEGEGYLQWVLGEDFPEDLHTAIEEVL